MCTELLSFNNMSMRLIFECNTSPICLGGRGGPHTCLLIRSSRADYIEASFLIVEVDLNEFSHLLRSEYLRTE